MHCILTAGCTVNMSSSEELDRHCLAFYNLVIQTMNKKLDGDNPKQLPRVELQLHEGMTKDEITKAVGEYFDAMRPGHATDHLGHLVFSGNKYRHIIDTVLHAKEGTAGKPSMNMSAKDYRDHLRKSGGFGKLVDKILKLGKPCVVKTLNNLEGPEHVLYKSAIVTSAVTEETHLLKVVKSKFCQCDELFSFNFSCCC